MPRLLVDATVSLRSPRARADRGRETGDRAGWAQPFRVVAREPGRVSIGRTHAMIAHAPPRLGSPAPSTPRGPEATVWAPPKNMFCASHSW